MKMKIDIKLIFDIMKSLESRTLLSTFDNYPEFNLSYSFYSFYSVLFHLVPIYITTCKSALLYTNKLCVRT